MRKLAIYSLLGLLTLGAGAANAQTPPAATGGKTSPVERPIAGDLGMSFQFGGLAGLNVGGLVSHTANKLFLTEIGMKYMLADKWALPFSIGVGMLNFSQEGQDAQFDTGLSFSVGFQRYFRTWRRIAPYFGVKMHFHYVDPTGASNYLVQLAFGPTLGVEYFIADRVSLGLEYALLIGMNFEDRKTTVGLQTVMSMGGQMALTFYF